MTLKETDSSLAAWDQRLAAIAANLLELQADGTYRALTGTGGAAKATISGNTAARLQPALGAMAGIFEHFALLNATIGRAGKLRASLPALFGTDARLREIEQLLCGNSITLPAPELQPDERSLLSGMPAGTSVSPEDLLATMTAAFAAAREAVRAAAEAWDQIATEIRQSEGQHAQLGAQMAHLSMKPSPELEAISGILLTVRARAGTDPLGALGDLRMRVHPLLAEAAKQVGAAEAMRSTLDGARLRLEELARLHAEALAAAKEARAKICNCDSLPAPLAEGKLEALEAWLDRLDRKRRDDGLEAAAVGLRHWTAAAESCAALDRHCCDGSRAPLETRAELRGRLGALKAKAHQYGLAEDAPVAALAQGAEVLLYTQPTDLRRAAAAVAGFEAVLQRTRKEANRS